MNRQNLFADAPWDSEERGPETGLVHRIFWRPDDARMGATLWDLSPGASGMRMHMHYGAEEMFFVISGRPVFRTMDGEEELAPGDFVVTDQFIDRTFAREKSFFGPGFVAHVPMAHPVCPRLSGALTNNV